MRKSTKPLQNLQGFCKKLQKIIRAPVKRLFERPLIQFCIIINYLFQCGSFFILNLENHTLNRVRFCFFCAAALRLVRIFLLFTKKQLKINYFTVIISMISY